MSNTMNYNIDNDGLNNIILESYQDMYDIMESLTDIKLCNLAYKGDIKYLTENAGEDKIDGRVERYNSDKASAIEKAKKKIMDFIKMIGDKLREFMNTFIIFIKKLIVSDKKLIEKYKDCRIQVEFDGYQYSITEVLHSTIQTINWLVMLPKMFKVEFNEKTLGRFKNKILDRDGTDNIDKQQFEKMVFAKLRRGNTEKIKIGATVSELCEALEYEKDIKDVYKLVNMTKSVFDPKYGKDLLDGFDIEDNDTQKAIAILGEINNTMIFTINSVKSAIVERNSMIRDAILRGVKENKDLVNESYVSILEGDFNIDEYLVSELGDEYYIAESYLEDNEILTEGVSNFKEKAIAIINKIIKFFKDIKDRVLSTIKSKLGKSRKKIAELDAKKKSIDNNTNVTCKTNREDILLYSQKLEDILASVDKTLVDIMMVANKSSSSKDVTDLKQFIDTNTLEIDFSTHRKELYTILGNKSYEITAGESTIVGRIIVGIYGTVTSKISGIEKTIDNMIKYNETTIKELKSNNVSEEYISIISILFNSQQKITGEFMTFLNSIVDTFDNLQGGLDKSVGFEESFTSVLDDEEVLTEGMADFKEKAMAMLRKIFDFIKNLKDKLMSAIGKKIEKAVEDNSEILKSIEEESDNDGNKVHMIGDRVKFNYDLINIPDILSMVDKVVDGYDDRIINILDLQGCKNLKTKLDDKDLESLNNILNSQLDEKIVKLKEKSISEFDRCKKESIIKIGQLQSILSNINSTMKELNNTIKDNNKLITKNEANQNNLIKTLRDNDISQTQSTLMVNAYKVYADTLNAQSQYINLVITNLIQIQSSITSTLKNIDAEDVEESFTSVLDVEVLTEGIKELVNKIKSKIKPTDNRNNTPKEYNKEAKEEQLLAEQKLVDSSVSKALSKFSKIKFSSSVSDMTGIFNDNHTPGKAYQYFKVFGYILHGDNNELVSTEEINRFKDYLQDLTKSIKYHTLEIQPDAEGWTMVKLSVKKSLNILVTESFTSVLDEEEFVYESILDQEDDTFVSVLDM